ncbi:DUF2721 domain-containing protein [Lysobacter silvisoli]|uniref:DUF2721 domain-containing protein n=1 Tax=Lysobacter silvisoli TaxID=2293254 RepID=A0A371K3H9_9GAMM|nr:DUF2721 domain-containing protein [Lysobacter silvisoli]RDZ28486.1 DUF2721 domain-containing protein [Lysobacter silvisoli]
MSQTAAAAPSFAHYAILTAMLAPAFFLTATASLLLSANNRLARVIDRARVLLKELAETEDEEERAMLESHIARQKKRSKIILRGSQLLYTAISFFVGTSLTVAGDAFLGYRLASLPTILAVFGVLAMFAASLLLARESSLAVEAVNEEMDHGHRRASVRRPRGGA